MSHYPEYDYLIINDDFELALQQFAVHCTGGSRKTASAGYFVTPICSISYWRDKLKPSRNFTLDLYGSLLWRALLLKMR